jgi:hypothetical protein
MKSWQIEATCVKCGKIKVKRKREINLKAYKCIDCFRKDRGKILGSQYGKKQEKQGSCLDCNTIISKRTKRCIACHAQFMSKRMSGKNNPSWTGTNICECGKRKSTGARNCKSCSFESGSRSGKQNGRYVNENRQLFLANQKAAKIARNMLSNYIKAKGIKKNLKTEKILNYSFTEFREHLENQFEEWMNWENYGLGIDKWNVDHIVPISFLNSIGINNPHAVNALCNLRPMNSIENIKKSNNFDPNLHEEVLQTILEMLGKA